jgi:transposase-like protein
MPRTTVLAAPLAALVDHSADCFEEDLLSLARRHLKTLLETSLDLELTAYLGCSHHARTGSRRGYRNGHYTRDFVSGLGLLENLRVPRCREGGFTPSLFERYQRRHQQVDAFIRNLFFLGVSTRGVGEALELLLGIAPSPATVSAVVAQVDAQVKAFHQRELPDHYLDLFLDAIHLPVKELPAAKKRAVLVAYGITQDGRRELVDYRIAQSESQAEWERFLNSLYERGLQGASLQLITTDGGSGLLAALPLVYGEVPHQLCWVHKLRNVEEHLKKDQVKPCLMQAQGIYRAKTRKAAREAWKEWKAAWEGVAPKAVACLARDLEGLLTFLDCPAAHHRLIRTTNYIERLLREARKRTDLMGAFANKASCDRMLYGVWSRINRNWSRTVLAAFQGGA